MADHSEDSQTLCPITRAASLVGDRWSIMIVRELSLGSSRFDEFLAQTGATPQLLASRLKRLEADGMISREPYSLRPLRHAYRLTQKGRDFVPVLFAFRAFGERWCKSEGEPVALRTHHRDCGGEVGLDGVCTACGGRTTLSDILASASEAYVEERRLRAQKPARAADREATPPDGRPQNSASPRLSRRPGR